MYTQPILLPLCATLLESFGALHQLAGYVSERGRAFYGEPADGTSVVLRRVGADDPRGVVPAAYVHPASASKSDGDAEKLQVMPFLAGQRLAWAIAQ